jgi:hypothetical protein
MAESNFVHTSALSKDKDQSSLFGKKEFALEDFAKINECAYFDYQRHRVLARERKTRGRRNPKAKKNERFIAQDKQDNRDPKIKLHEVRRQKNNEAG